MFRLAFLFAFVSSFALAQITPAPLPPQAGQAGKYLSTNGSKTAWGTPGGAPAGADTQVQFNNAGAFGGSSAFTWNGSSLAATRLTLGTPGAVSGTDAALDVFGATNGIIHAQNSGAQSTTGGAAIIGYAVPAGAAMLSGNRLGAYVLGGSTDGANGLGNASAVTAFATQNWSAGATGSNLVFETTANGGTTRAAALTLGQDKAATFAGNIGIGGLPSAQYKMAIAGTLNGNSNMRSLGLLSIVDPSIVTSQQINILALNSVLAGTLPLLIDFYASQGTFTGTVTNHEGFRAASTMIGATNNYGFRGLIPAAANRFNLFMDGTALNHMTGALLIGTQTDDTVNKLQVNGGVAVAHTITTPGTTGDQTIDKAAGRVNIAAAGSSIVITNNLVTANSHVFCSIASNDTTAIIKNCVPAAGSFTARTTANVTAETPIDFFVVNGF